VSGFGRKKDSVGSNKVGGAFGMSFNMSGVAGGRDRQNHESGFVDQMLLEDLNDLHKNKDLMGGSPPGIDSFNKYEQHLMQSNEDSPN